jgi:quercetin dioxygenase-like cupin family protein
VSFTLRLTEDRLGPGSRLALPPTPRVLYTRNGTTRIENRPPAAQAGLADAATTNTPRIENRPPTAQAALADPATINTPRIESRPPAAQAGLARPATTNTAWHGVGDVVVAADAPAMVLRFELIAAGKPDARDAESSESRRLLEHPIDLDRTRAWLMRCDRVDFAPGGVALPHGHKGGGIRCLLAGTLEVTVGDRPPRLMLPGDAWFESGREPVLAKASPESATAFVRVSILPREIRGQSSIVYVDPADAGRGRPREYTVYVDEPISLP